MNSSRFLAVSAVLLAMILSPLPSFAQRSTPDRLKAVRVDSPIDLDGALDEEAWVTAPRISNFTQKELVENEPATEKTEVAVLFTKTDLYIGVWCFDTMPDRIIAQKMSWDFDYGTEDNFEIVLDTYADRRNAYFFVINPNGAQYDSLITDNGRRSYQVFSSELAILPRPKFLPWVRQLELKPFEISYYIDDITKEMQSVYIEIVPLAMSLKSGESTEFNLHRNAENLTEEFEIRDGYIIPAGRYWTNRAELQIETFEGRPVVADVAIDWGQFYDGSSTEWETQLTWIPKPGASLYFVFNQFGDTLDPPGRVRINKTVAMIKFVWYFNTK